MIVLMLDGVVSFGSLARRLLKATVLFGLHAQGLAWNLPNSEEMGPAAKADSRGDCVFASLHHVFHPQAFQIDSRITAWLDFVLHMSLFGDHQFVNDWIWHEA